MTTPRPGPRSDDTYDLIDDALFKLAERRGAWLGDDLIAITLIASLIDQAERFLPELVTNARLNGHTWDQIAQALATSPDQAQLRYGPQSPIADTRWHYDLQPRAPTTPSAGAVPRRHALAPVARPGIPRSLPSRRQRRRRSRWSARSEARTNDLEVRQAAATIGNEEGH
jgi:hypothetical protein